jgi:serine beta-lactamase-like protein LACTB
VQIASHVIPRLLSCALLVAQPAAAKPLELNDQLLDALRLANNVPGMSAAIIKDGKLVWQGHTGHADVARKVPVSASTRYRLASVSKFVTATMLARLVEQDRINLSAPVSHYLPDFPAKAYPFTSLQLSAHIAGVPHYDMKLDARRDEVVAPFKTVTAGLEIFKNRPLLHQPGTAFAYSSFGFNLLAAVMERAAKDDYQTQLAALAAFAKAPSLEPELLDADRKHWSALYEGGREAPRGNITYNWAGGGLLSNAADLARVGAATLDPAYISAKTLALFTTPVQFANGAEVVAEGYTMGIGWRLNTDQHGRRYFHHSGVTLGARSHISVYPDQRLVVAILSNASWTSAMDMTARSLAEPMFGDAGEGECAPGSLAYQGKYKDKPISGSVHFEPIGKQCKAVFEADNAFGKWLGHGGGATSFTLYGQAGRMALVTPLGLFPATRHGTSMTLTIMGKPLELALGVP